MVWRHLGSIRLDRPLQGEGHMLAGQWLTCYNPQSSMQSWTIIIILPKDHYLLLIQV